MPNHTPKIQDHVIHAQSDNTRTSRQYMHNQTIHAQSDNTCTIRQYIHNQTIDYEGTFAKSCVNNNCV